jgi:hypothetical protein
LTQEEVEREYGEKAFALVVRLRWRHSLFHSKPRIRRELVEAALVADAEECLSPTQSSVSGIAGNRVLERLIEVLERPYGKP